MPKLFNNESLKRDIYETLIAILAQADLAHLRTLDREEFEQSFIDEAHFLIPCDKTEMGQVEQYIHQHVNELYQIATI